MNKNFAAAVFGKGRSEIKDRASDVYRHLIGAIEYLFEQPVFKNAEHTDFEERIKFEISKHSGIGKNLACVGFRAVTKDQDGTQLSCSEFKIDINYDNSLYIEITTQDSDNEAVSYDKLYDCFSGGPVEAIAMSILYKIALAETDIPQKYQVFGSRFYYFLEQNNLAADGMHNNRSVA